MKRIVASCLLFVSTLLVNSGTASILTIGVEEMPDSIKKLR
ncbi:MULTISPECIES: hypothetical protein [Clostridium]|nr:MULTISPECIES: hypothetical protein [Clostridium]CUO76229.1 Uncharacterised protein [Clostridium disporicum]